MGGHYGYCLGTVLNFLGRFEESVPMLREQAAGIQPDAQSWFQLGAAYGDLGQSARAIEAYEKALALDPDYDLAMFKLGGVYWNSGEKIEALRIWKAAIDRFPDHELAAKLQRDMPVFFVHCSTIRALAPTAPCRALVGAWSAESPCGPGSR